MKKRLRNWTNNTFIACVITVLILISIETGTRIYLVFFGKQKNINEETYEMTEWFQKYLIEFRESRNNNVTWHPYTYWRRKPYIGEYINISQNGFRKTYNFTSLSDARIKIFTFGGSTMWGTGARDEFTIPSFISKLLYEKGYKDVHVVNLGETGYVSTQEIFQLILELKKGNIPHIAIFYDGVNDVFAALQSRISGIPQNEYYRYKEFNLDGIGFFDFLIYKSLFLREVLQLKKVRPLGKIRDIELYGSVVKTYLNNIKTVEILSKGYNFETYFFWQPVVFVKNLLSNNEMNIKRNEEAIEDFYMNIYKRISKIEHKPESFYDLQEIFDNERQSIFIDFCHISEQGNKMVAERIAKILIEQSTKLPGKDVH